MLKDIFVGFFSTYWFSFQTKEETNDNYRILLIAESVEKFL